jgi:hypothetical protein
MGLFSFVGGLLGAGAQKKASRNAQAAMNDALNKAIGTEQHQYEQTRQDFMPYLNGGVSAFGQLGNLAGANGADQWQTAIAALQQSPYYQSLYNNGQEAVLQNASATGGIRGGNTQTGLANFGRDTLAMAIQQQLQNLGGIANMGLGAAGSVGGFGANQANAVAGLQQNIGQNNSSNILTRGGINAGMWNSAGGFLDSAVSAALGAFPGLGGGGGGGFSAFASKLF